MSTSPGFTSGSTSGSLPGSLSSPVSRLLSALTAGLALLASLGVALVASAGTASAADTVSPPGGAWVRTGHFVPGMDKAKVALEPADPRGRAPEVGEINYGDVTSYQKLAPGTYTATVTASSADEGAEPLLTSSFEVTAGQARTVAVVGTADAPRVTLLTDDLTPPEPDTARVRLLSATDQTDTVTVRALMGPTVADGAVLGQATPYKTVPAGPWTLALMGGDASSTRQQVDIASGSVYTVVVLDSPGGGTELSVVTDAAGAVVAPRGGAETGQGGMAGVLDQGSSPVPGAILASLAVTVAVGTAVGVRRRKVAGAQA